MIHFTCKSEQWHAPAHDDGRKERGKKHKGELPGGFFQRSISILSSTYTCIQTNKEMRVCVCVCVHVYMYIWKGGCALKEREDTPQPRKSRSWNSWGSSICWIHTCSIYICKHTCVKYTHLSLKANPKILESHLFVKYKYVKYTYKNIHDWNIHTSASKIWFSRFLRVVYMLIYIRKNMHVNIHM